MGKIIQMSDVWGKRELIRLPRTAFYDRCDYVVNISGHGMEPDFPDGSDVLVSRSEKVAVGDVGIFLIGDKTSIKEFGKNELVCINKDYPNIPINKSDNIVCLGKVIGLYDKKGRNTDVTP